jgi:lactoylglutathione lyase
VQVNTEDSCSLGRRVNEPTADAVASRVLPEYKAMETEKAASPNVKQATPFFGVTDIEASLRFYLEGLGFTMTNHWAPEGRVRWCWLQLGDAAIMLQEYWQDGRPAGVPDGPLGQGVSIYFICKDALAIYHDLIARGISASLPFVGNGMWVISVQDPDGYRLFFESPTDVAEDTVYAG